MKIRDADILIIGAGVVGCALAYECAKRFPNKTIEVVEKNSRIGSETSSHNSGMLHTGLAEKTGSFKSMLCVRGYKLANAFIASHNVTAKKTGMLIAIPKHLPKKVFAQQLERLSVLVTRATRLGLPYRFIAFGKQNYEPGVLMVAGLYLPEFSIINSLEFTQKLREAAETTGVKFNLNCSATSIELEKNSYLITAADHIFKSSCVINSAGLYADEIAAMAGFTEYKIYPWRGEYYKVLNKQYAISMPVSSVMPRHHGKGVQILPSVDGTLYIGPNSYPTKQKNDYRTINTPPEEFIERVKGLLPNIQAEDLKWAFAGIRPRLHNDYADTDFIISKDNDIPAFINLIGIESPGLTSALAIGEYVSEKLIK